MVYRKRIQMLSDLLNAAESGDVNKTTLFYGVGTRYDYFKRLLRTSIKKRFISVKKEKYSLTRKGKEFLGGWEGYTRIRIEGERLLGASEDKKQELIKRYELERL